MQELELNKIYNEDCLEGMKRIPEGSIDMVVTSPPYDNLRTYDKNVDSSWGEHVWKPLIKELYRVIKEGGVVVWNVKDATIQGSETGTSFRQALYFMECGFNLHDTMIWEKDCFTFPQKTTYRDVFEYMFVFVKGKISTANLIADRKNKTAGQTVHGTQRERDGSVRKKACNGNLTPEYGVRFNVWQIPGEKHNVTGHPAVFPVSIAKDHILTWSNKGDVVLDPFMGSGTTAVACLQTQRNYIGFEMSEEYYAKSLERIKDELAEPTLFDYDK